MSSENKICTRSKVKVLPEVLVPVNESSEITHTCGKGKGSHPAKKSVTSTKRPSNPKVSKKNNSKKNPSSLKLIANPNNENFDDGANTESNTCLPSVDSTDASVGKIQNLTKPSTRASKQKKIISKTLFSTDSSSFDSSVPNSPILKNVSDESPKHPAKRRRISSSDSQENPTGVISSPKVSGGAARVCAFKKSLSMKKKVCFSDSNEVFSDSASSLTEFNLPCTSVSVCNFAQSSPKKPKKRRKLVISCEQQSTSSESEVNSNKEFFIISDSELNNYMNSDQELNMQFIASSEEEETIHPNENALEGGPKTNPERDATAKESKFICVYKDQQLKSLEDGESHAVVINQSKMLAALDYYLSEKNFSAEKSPTKSIGPTLNEIHPDLFLSPPSAEVVSNLQLDKEFDGNVSTLELSPKLLSYGNADQKAQMSLHDSRLLPDVSLSYDPSVEELARSPPKEVVPSKTSPSPKKRSKRLRGKKKYKKRSPRKGVSKSPISSKEKSPELQSSQEGAKTTDLDCSSKNATESDNIEASIAPDEVAIADSELAVDDVRTDSGVVDNGPCESSDVPDISNGEASQSRTIERKDSDDADQLVIFNDDENLDFEPDTECPSYSLEKNQSPEHSKAVEANSPSPESLNDWTNDEGLSNFSSPENSCESSLKDRKLAEEASARETVASGSCGDLVHNSHSYAVECNDLYNKEVCEQTNFEKTANSKKPPETDLETELEVEEAWSASEINSPLGSEENVPLPGIPAQDNAYSYTALSNTKQNIRSGKRDSASDGELSDDSSEEDTDHSFKRRDQQNKQVRSECKRQLFNGHRKESTQDTLSSTSTSLDKSYDSPVEGGMTFILQSPPYQGGRKLNFNVADRKTTGEEVRNTNDVFARIVSLCEKCDIKGAIEVSKRFISISSTTETRERIFQGIFWAVMGYITHPACPDPSSEAAELASCVLDVFYEFNLRSPHMCSMIVCKSLQHPVSVPHALDVVQICFKHCILLSEAALATYIRHLTSAETSVNAYLEFLEYVKKCGEFGLPKPVLGKALGLFLANREGQSLPLFKRICDLLCGVGASGVEESVRGFLACCVENECWLEMVKCFKAWSRMSSSCHILSQVIAVPLHLAGMHYGKFAATLHDGVESLPLNLTHLFGQFGVMLMLEAYSKDELKAALEVLFIMHRYNINYYELQVPLYQMDYLDSLLKAAPACPEPVYSFTVAFAAVDVFIQTAKPKTAFTVLQGFTKSLPANLNEVLRSKITPQLYRYFLKLSQILHQIDPLYKGLEALNAFLSTMETHVNQDLKGVAISNMNDLRTVYLQNSVSLLNAERVREAFHLFHRCASLFQDDLKPQKFVVRGLLTAASQHRMKEEANQMYLFGCMKKIYIPAKLDFELEAWNLLVESCWTRSEIRFVLATFLEDINRFYILSKRKLMDQNLYTLRIQFKPDPKEFSPELKCLKVSSTFDAALERVGLELRIVDPNLSWTVDSTAKAVIINPNSLYNFWESKFSELKQDQPHSFLIRGNHKYSFGSDNSEASPPSRSSSNVTLQSPVSISPPYTTMLPPVSPTVISKPPQTVSPTVTARHSHSRSPSVTTKFPLSSSPHVKTKSSLSSSPTVTTKSPQSFSPTVTTKSSPTVTTKYPPHVTPPKKAVTVNHPNSGSPSKKVVGANHPNSGSPSKKVVGANHPNSGSPSKKAVKANHPISDCSTKQALLANYPFSINSTVTTKQSASVGPLVSKKPSSTAATAKPQSTATTSKPLVSVPPSSSAPEMQRQPKRQILPPMQSEPVIMNDEFQKVVLFVKARVFLKCKHLSPQEREEKAINLAKAFVNEHNITTKLDKKGMKLLNDYTEKNIAL